MTHVAPRWLLLALPPLALATFALVAAACGDDASEDGDSGSGGSASSGSTGGEEGCPRFSPGGAMLGVDWGLDDEGNAKFGAYAQAAADVTGEIEVTIRDVAEACFQLATATDGTPLPLSSVVTLQNAQATCTIAKAAWPLWHGDRPVTIDITPPTCAIGAVDPACTAACDGQASCDAYCTASANANATCTPAVVDVSVTDGEDPARLQAIGDALERLVVVLERFDYLAAAAEGIGTVPSGPRGCQTFTIDALKAGAADLSTLGQVTADVISTTAE